MSELLYVSIFFFHTKLENKKIMIQYEEGDSKVKCGCNVIVSSSRNFTTMESKKKKSNDFMSFKWSKNKKNEKEEEENC